MRAGQSHLFISGPTDAPETVRRALNVPTRDVRAPYCRHPASGLFEGLKGVFRTWTGGVVIRPGADAREAAIIDTPDRPRVCSPRRRVTRR